MKTKRTINYPDFNVACDICGERFKTPQGLSGHKQFKHNLKAVIAGEAEPGTSPAGPAGPSVKDLKGQVERLKLEKEKRQLTSELPSTATRPDLMEQLGLGPFDPEVKAQAQRRAMAMGGSDQGQAQTWLDKLLSNPEGLKVAIAGLKGILGTGQNTGDGTATLLKDLGFNLKDLILSATAPKAGTLSIGGLDLTGANLTPELLTSLMDYKAKTEAAQKDYEGKKLMSDTLASAIETIGTKLVGSFRGSRGQDQSISQEIIDRQPPPAERFAIECSACGFHNEIPADAKPGSIIKCQGKDKYGNPCEESWIVEDPEAQRKQRSKEKKIEVQEPPKSIACENCGQLINIEGTALGSEVTCPVCQRTQVLMSPDIALDPGPTEDQDPYGIRDHGRQFLRE